MARELTDREREVLAWMAEHAVPVAPDEPDVDKAARARWRKQLPTTRAGRACGCGACPSIELRDPDGITPTASVTRVVLSAEVDRAVLLLFVDDDRLSYLELAPLSDDAFTEFPDPSDLRTA